METGKPKRAGIEDIHHAEKDALQMEAAFCREEGFTQQEQSVEGELKLEGHLAVIDLCDVVHDGAVGIGANSEV